MPTIEELVPAAAASDDDYIPVSQAGTMRRVTRSQMLAGVQSALAVGQGGLLGRSSAGIGAPEVIAVGANLNLTAGVLSGHPAFSVQGLPVGSAVGAADIVAVCQNGRDGGVPVGALLSSLSHIPGLDLSSQLVNTVGGVARALSDWFTDAIPVEAFGAVGDGVTDDTASINQAMAVGRPVRFGPRTYVLNGQWTVTQPAVLLGVPGRTILLRKAQNGGAWISVGGHSFTAVGIVFDAGSVPVESWGVLVEATCTQTLFELCSFRNATGNTLGSGLTIGARDGLSGSPSRHVVRGCEASGNAVHGIWVQAAAGALIQGCSAYSNGQYGICVDFNDPAFQQTVRHCEVVFCRAWSNKRGISVGNYNETNLEPPRWGNANPDAIGIIVTGNVCYNNADYGIAVSGQAMQVVDNLVEMNGSGLLVNAASSMISSNVIVGPGQFGIDAGGSEECDIVSNSVQGFAVGINPGGSRNLRVAGNGLVENVWGITAYGMETDGHGSPFGIACSGLTIEHNRIQLKDASGGGIFLIDAPQSVLLTDNSFISGSNSSPSQALWAHTDQLTQRNNLWNNQARMICNPTQVGSLYQVQIPDILDAAMLTSAGQPISSIMGQHQAAAVGQITFIKLVAGGSGYTHASVSITGSGSGATAIAYVRDGAVVAVAMTSSGAGYGPSGAVVSISGDGTGAQAVASVGLPVQEERRLRLHCNSAVKFKRVGSNPFQDNWTGFDILVPQASVIEWVGTWGGWQAVSFPLGDYIAPTGDGGLMLRSSVGDVVIRPAGAGQYRVSSDTEPQGFSTLLGRGSPNGIVNATAGSDYRNLDGGQGNTLWVKQSQAGASGWIAIA